jgi:hypothetical protein
MRPTLTPTVSCVAPLSATHMHTTCCRLNTRPGELPVEFECDERSHPALSDDLLHLVHGRTLLGVVTTPATLRLEGTPTGGLTFQSQ